MGTAEMEEASSAFVSSLAAMEALKPQWVETPVGRVEVRLALPAGSPIAIAVLIHGMNPSQEIRFEWGFLSEALRTRKTAAIFPDLHSCERTTPGKGSAEDVASALEAIVSWARLQAGDSEDSTGCPLLVYGKSWGGGRALELCGRQGDAVAGLCLACPAIDVANSGDIIASLSAPVLLVWAQDDNVIPFSTSAPLVDTFKARTSGHTIFAPVDTGGHRVDVMAAASEAIALKLAEWPDLAMGPLRSRK